jgi:hypothetical protein
MSSWRNPILVVVAKLVVVTLGGPGSPRPPKPGRPVAAGPSPFDALATATRQTGIRLAAMECPPDLRGCTSPREHRRNFLDGKYGYAAKHIHYAKTIKRHFLRAARAVWRHKRSNKPWRNNRYRWRRFTAGDRCIVSTYGTRTNTCIQQQREAFNRYNVVLKKVVVCGAQLIPEFRLKKVADRLLAAIPGGLICPGPRWTQTCDPDL